MLLRFSSAAARRGMVAPAAPAPVPKPQTADHLASMKISNHAFHHGKLKAALEGAKQTMQRPMSGMHFWTRATFDPWAAAHEGVAPPEYLGISQAEQHWVPQDDWYRRRNLTERVLHLFPLMDTNADDFVDLPELERWHHVNKVFIEKARAALSMVRMMHPRMHAPCHPNVALHAQCCAHNSKHHDMT